LDRLGLGLLELGHADLGLLDRALRRRLGELAGDQVVAQVALGHLHDGAALADALDVLQQDGLGHRQRSSRRPRPRPSSSRPPDGSTYGSSASSRAFFTAVEIWFW